MKTYHVEWEIDIEAESPRDAARQALEIQRDPNSLATSFLVTEHYPDSESFDIDLTFGEEEDS